MGRCGAGWVGGAVAVVGGTRKHTDDATARPRTTADHDLFDGWGSYPADTQTCAVFKGIYKAARR